MSMLHRHVNLKRVSSRIDSVGALAIIGLGVVLRLILLGQSWPVNDSDESTMGLMALHIAYRGEHPIFMYGQNYMGSLEPFFGAALFRLFGPSLFTLRLALLALFVLFLVSLYRLTCLLYTKKLALASLILLSLGSTDMLIRELKADGGVAETLVCGTLLLLLASRLALTADQPLLESRQRWRRALLYGGWGLTAGVGLWSDLLVGPFVLASGLLLLLFCWREWRTRAPRCLLPGLLLGAFPLITYNITAAPGQDSLSVLFQIHGGSGLPFSLGQQIMNAVQISLPTITGISPSCHFTASPPITFLSAHPLLCTLYYTGWGMGVIVLWLLAVGLTGMTLWKVWRGTPKRQWSHEERHTVIRQCARLALLGSVGLTLFLYILSPAAAHWPVTDARYLTGLLVAMPACISPLWPGPGKLPARVIRVVTSFQAATLLFIALAYLAGTVSIFHTLPATQAEERRQEALIHNLLLVGATHIYSDYWTCNRLIFESNEQIICDAIDGNLRPGMERYLPYRTIVQGDPRAAYVLLTGSPEAMAFAQRGGRPGILYQHVSFDGYEIYQPTRPQARSPGATAPSRTR
ncbi:MAG: hypothetical protein ABI456_10805 [Ktedonobacteraceae bacterium]